MSDDALDPVLAELAEQAGDLTRTSPMMLGAWGLGLIRRFETLGRAEFERLVTRAHVEQGEEAARLLKRALQFAAVEGAAATLRDDLLYDFEEAHVAWVIGA